MAQGEPSPYLKKREGQLSVYVCPHDQLEFEYLYALKRHLEREHGGFSWSDISAAASGERGDAPGASNVPAGATGAQGPRKVSRKSRELNEKLNECISLIARRVMHGLKEDEKEKLLTLKGEILVNSLGFDFDFEKGLVPLHSRFWLVVMLIVTQAENIVPEGVGGKITAILKAKKNAKEADDEKSD